MTDSKRHRTLAAMLVVVAAALVRRAMSSIMEPPGPRHSFVYVGRQSRTSPWKVLEIGSGP
ncbi:MAG: hypothetical protein M1337_03385 [Actinobacteria bacterium]|nr:hypothetical protein [Actinomycetota bacterium]